MKQQLFVSCGRTAAGNGAGGNCDRQAAVHGAFMSVCPFLDSAFYEAVLDGSHVGFL